jgi:membrane protease YdiL (CAAX protease family)
LRKSSHWYLFGLKPDIYAIIEVFVGLGIVVAAFGIISIIYLVLGGTFQISQLNFNGIAYISYFLFLGAFLEELLCRGIIFQALSSRLGGVIATLIMSSLFASLHLSNYGITVVSFLNVFLAGVVLSTMYLKTKSLWIPLSFHFFWNFLQVVAIDSPVSGIYYFSQYAILDWTVPTNAISSILLGGVFGIEGGIITTILLVLIFLLFLKFVRISQGINTLLLKRAITESKF